MVHCYVSPGCGLSVTGAAGPASSARHASGQSMLTPSRVSQAGDKASQPQAEASGDENDYSYECRGCGQVFATLAP